MTNELLVKYTIEEILKDAYDELVNEKISSPKKKDVVDYVYERINKTYSKKELLQKLNNILKQ